MDRLTTLPSPSVSGQRGSILLFPCQGRHPGKTPLPLGSCHILALADSPGLPCVPGGALLFWWMSWKVLAGVCSPPATCTTKPSSCESPTPAPDVLRNHGHFSQMRFPSEWSAAPGLKGTGEQEGTHSK